MGTSTDRNRKFMFVGPSGVGKTFFSRYCGKVLSNDGKKVAIIDASEDRGLFYSAFASEKSESTNALLDLAKGKNTAVAYGNIDIFTNTPAEKNIPYDKVFRNLQDIEEEYDAVLIDADYKLALEICPSARILLVQDFKRESAILNQQKFLVPLVLKFGEGSIPETAIIYNKKMDSCKLKLEQIEQYLMFARYDSRIIRLLMDSNPQEFQVLFEQENYLADLNNIADGAMETKRFTPDMKKSLYTICNMITELGGNLKKLV